jgi:hypothetical protein
LCCGAANCGKVFTADCAITGGTANEYTKPAMIEKTTSSIKVYVNTFRLLSLFFSLLKIVIPKQKLFL